MKHIFLFTISILFAGISNAATLQWETTKAAAFAKALQEDKLVLMMRGNPACMYCQNAKDVICETTEPDIVGLIQENYIPWFTIAATTEEGEEYSDRIPIGPGAYTIINRFPIFACIDPHFTNKCYDISIGDLKIGVELTATSFYSRLTSHIIEKSKEKVKLKIFWEKTNKDKLLFKLKFLAEVKPFNDDSEVKCLLGRNEDEIIALKKATVSGNRLKIKSNNAKLKLSWNKKTKVCSLVFNIKKYTLPEILTYESYEWPRMGARAAKLEVVIDNTSYPK